MAKTHDPMSSWLFLSNDAGYLAESTLGVKVAVWASGAIVNCWSWEVLGYHCWFSWNSESNFLSWYSTPL